jgi:hypothetical protein
MDYIMTECHIHEFMDRLHCLQMVVDSNIVQHKCYEEYKVQVEELADKIADLYQQVGAARCGGGN